MAEAWTNASCIVGDGPCSCMVEQPGTFIPRKRIALFLFCMFGVWRVQRLLGRSIYYPFLDCSPTPVPYGFIQLDCAPSSSSVLHPSSHSVDMAYHHLHPHLLISTNLPRCHPHQSCPSLPFEPGPSPNRKGSLFPFKDGGNRTQRVDETTWDEMRRNFRGKAMARYPHVFG